MPSTSRLERDESAEVCVIGAGIAGLSTAYALARAGKSVVVLEAGPVGGGMTGRTSAHLSSAIDDRFVEIERVHGVEAAALAAQSHATAIDWIESVAAHEGIECGFQRVDGYLFAASEKDASLLEEEHEAAQRAGLDTCLLGELPAQHGFATGPCLRFGRQAQFEPLRYLAGLAHAAEYLGVRIYGDTHVNEVEGGVPTRVLSRAGPSVRCNAIVVATNSPINDMVVIHTKQAAYLTYVIAARLPQHAIEPALFWDTGDPYHYVRLAAGNGSDLLLIGGEDHKTGQADDQPARFDRLEEWARARFPIGAVTHRWSGQVLETIDGLAFIGRNPLDKPNVFVATGDSGMGLTHGTIAGILLTDLILGRDHPWAKIYDPARKPLRALPRFARENLNVVRQYATWLSGGDVDAASEVAPGQGCIVQRGTTKVAVYRTEEGLTHELSAVCPHLGCIVAWNAVEKSWDCPCHGSRFDCAGHVITGPALAGLKPVDSRDPDSVHTRGD